MYQVPMLMNNTRTIGKLCCRTWNRSNQLQYMLKYFRLCFSSFHSKHNHLFTYVKQQLPKGWQHSYTTYLSNAGNVAAFERKSGNLVALSTMAGTDTPLSDISDALENRNFIVCPVKTEGPPHIFSSLHFEKAAIKKVDSGGRKRKLSGNAEQNCHQEQLTDDHVMKQKRSILSPSLLQEVTQYVRDNSDKVPLPKCVADIDILETCTCKDVLNNETELGFIGDILAGDEELTELEKDAIPSLSSSSSSIDDENGTDQHRHQLFLDDVYNISPLFLDTWPIYDLKSRKRKISSDGLFQKQSDHLNREKDGDSSESKKKRPNYFVAIQIKNPQIHKGIAMVQDHIEKQEPLLSPAMIPLATLHLTLTVLYLDKEDLDRAQSALIASCKKLDYLTSDPLTFTVRGIGNFRNNVIFAKLEDGKSKERLEGVASCVSECFVEYGLISPGHNDFKAHLTILKLSRAPKLYKKGIKKVDPFLYHELTDTIFGKQTVTELQLCSMLKPKDEHGYYHVEHAECFLPSTYEEEPVMIFFSDKSLSAESVASRGIVTEAVISAIHKLRQEALEESRIRKSSVKSENQAKKVLCNALKELKSEEERENSITGNPVTGNQREKVFIAELEKELAWKFEIGENPSKEYVMKLLKKPSAKENH